MKFLHTRRRFSTAGRWVGLALGIATIGVGERVWREWRRAPADRSTAVEAQGERRGRAHVGDGDSVTIEATRLRLVGIDAPELAQDCVRGGRSSACGEEAKAHLAGLIDGRPIDCAWRRRDRYGRGLARCRVGGQDLGAAMVRDGWAVAYGGYEAEEAEARRARRGLWAGRFEWPEDFRRRERERSSFVDDDDAEER